MKAGSFELSDNGILYIGIPIVLFVGYLAWRFNKTGKALDDIGSEAGETVAKTIGTLRDAASAGKQGLQKAAGDFGWWWSDTFEAQSLSSASDAPALNASQRAQDRANTNVAWINGESNIDSLSADNEFLTLGAGSLTGSEFSLEKSLASYP